MAEHEREVQELAEIVAAWRAIPEGDRRTTMLEGAGEGWVAENLRILAGISEFGAPEEPLDEERWGELEIGSSLGTDDLGEIWSARTVEGEEVRLRLFRRIEGDPTRARTDVVQEAASLRALRHPGVVPVHGVAAHGGRLGVWSDRVDEDPVAEDGPVWETAYAVASVRALASALGACRAAGLHGRDLSPARLVAREGGAVLAEPLGCGPRPEGDDPVPGAWRAAAPEVWRGAAGDSRSDVWSLAALAAQRLTGRWPCEETTAGGLLARHQDGRAPDVAGELPGPIRSVLRRALRPDAADRWAGPDELAAAFARAADQPAGPGLLGRVRDLFR